SDDDAEALAILQPDEMIFHAVDVRRVVGARCSRSPGDGELAGRRGGAVEHCQRTGTTAAGDLALDGGNARAGLPPGANGRGGDCDDTEGGKDSRQGPGLHVRNSLTRLEGSPVC